MAKTIKQQAVSCRVTWLEKAWLLLLFLGPVSLSWLLGDIKISICRMVVRITSLQLAVVAMVQSVVSVPLWNMAEECGVFPARLEMHLRWCVRASAAVVFPEHRVPCCVSC